VTKKRVYLLLATALVIAVLQFFTNPYRYSILDYELKLGQIADRDIIAPFEFSIYKSPETIEAEREAIAAKIRPVYRVSDNLKYNAQKNLDYLLIVNKDSNIEERLQKSGYSLSKLVVEYLKDDGNRLGIYNYLTEKLSRIFDIGIYPQNYPYKEIKIARHNRIIDYHLSRLYSLEEAKEKLVEGIESEIKRKAITEIANYILIENIVIDNDLTRLERQQAKEEVPLTIGKVMKNEKIVSKNQKITANELLKINSLLKAQQQQQISKTSREIIFSAGGTFLLTSFLLLFFYYTLVLFFKHRYTSYSHLYIILAAFLVSILFAVLTNSVFKINSLVIPFSFSVLLIALIFNLQIGILFNFINLVLVAHFLNWSCINPLILALASLGGIIALKNPRNRQNFLSLALYLTGTYVLVQIALSLIRFSKLSLFITNLLWGLLSIFISIAGLMIIVPIIEKKLNMATKGVLLELLDFNNPLLKKLSVIAPGTYHHSLIVGNLAESAAEAIGANYLLARVGSYYHDIGKLESPQFFIENDADSSEYHDKMLANESAVIIKKHINDGISLAKKHNLPRRVIDIIRQHHGTGKIKYFYNKAKEMELDIDETQFQYHGPKPQSKEAAIVMIADIVESTSKSLNDFSENKIRKVLDDTVWRLIKEGQLDESPLTIKELKTIKKNMLPILMGVYRKRLEYPEN
jgi:hypothetical protein